MPNAPRMTAEELAAMRQEDGRPFPEGTTRFSTRGKETLTKDGWQSHGTIWDRLRAEEAKALAAAPHAPKDPEVPVEAPVIEEPAEEPPSPA